MKSHLSLIASIVLAPLFASAQLPASSIDEVIADSIATEDFIDDDILMVPDTVEVAQVLLSDDEILAAAGGIISRYSKPWSDLSMQGKLIFEGLPVKPTVKIYMKRNESIILSARASIFGEVARIEMNNDSLTFINKHTKKYTSVNLKPFSSQYPDMLSDFQDLLLGEIAYPGHGRLTADLAAKSEWSYEEDLIFLAPSDDLQLPGIGYCFLIDPTDQKLHDFILLIASNNMILDFNYLFGIEGWSLAMAAYINGKSLQGTLQLSYPDYFPTPLDFTDAGSRYSCTDLKGVLKF